VTVKPTIVEGDLLDQATEGIVNTNREVWFRIPPGASCPDSGTKEC